jgi:retron-type reverse transcriptase
VEEHIEALQRDLRDHLYRPQPLLAASMPKPSGGRRALAIPTVRDRIAQCAAALVITPILEREFEAASFGFRRDRSVPHAVAEVRRYRDEGYRWIVEADIDNFFDEVDHGRLLARLEEAFPTRYGRPSRVAHRAASDGPRLIERTRGCRRARRLPVLPTFIWIVSMKRW